MKREIKNDGAYVEVDATEVLGNIESLEKAKVVVVTSVRVELAGEDKDGFLRRMKEFAKFNEETLPTYLSSFSNAQKSDIAFRQALSGDR
jgi:hypothetical protein